MNPLKLFVGFAKTFLDDAGDKRLDDVVKRSKSVKDLKVNLLYFACEEAISALGKFVATQAQKTLTDEKEKPAINGKE